MADPTENLPIKQRVLVQEKIIADQKEIISSLKSSVQNLEELLKKEQTLNEDKQKVIVQQQNTISEQQNTIKELDNIIREQQVSIVTQQKELAAAHQEIKEKNEQLLRINTEWESQTSLLKNKIFELQNEITEKEKKYHEIIEQREQKIKELTDKTKELEIELNRLKTQTSDLVSKSQLNELNEKIKELEKIIADKDATIIKLKEQTSGIDMNLKTELEIKEIKIAELEKRLKMLSESKEVAAPVGDQSNIILTRDAAIEGIKKLIGELKSTALIFIPTIDYIEELRLDDLKPTIRIKLATFIDRTNQKHIELFNKYSSLNNIEIKLYNAKDLWAINKDLEVLLFAPIGNDNSIAGLIVKTLIVLGLLAVNLLVFKF